MLLFYDILAFDGFEVSLTVLGN